MGSKGRTEARIGGEERNASPASAVAPLDVNLPLDPALRPVAIEVDAIMAYVAVYQPGTELGPAMAPCPWCGVWAISCRWCVADFGSQAEALECPGCGRSCRHAVAGEADGPPHLRALHEARTIWNAAASSITMAVALFRAANRVQLTTAESKAMWDRVDAAMGGPLAAATTMDPEVGIALLNRAIRGERP